jgi:hypothetical protein
MAGTEDARKQLVDFLDRKVFDPIAVTRTTRCRAPTSPEAHILLSTELALRCTCPSRPSMPAWYISSTPCLTAGSHQRSRSWRARRAVGL